MVLDILNSLPEVAIPLREIMISEVANDAFGVGVKSAGESDLLSENHFENFVGIIIHEGTSAHHQFVYKDAQAVPVYCFPMSFVH